MIGDLAGQFNIPLTSDWRNDFKYFATASVNVPVRARIRAKGSNGASDMRCYPQNIRWTFSAICIAKVEDV